VVKDRGDTAANIHHTPATRGPEGAGEPVLNTEDAEITEPGTRPHEYVLGAFRDSARSVNSELRRSRRSASNPPTCLPPIGLNRWQYKVGSAEPFNRMHVASNPAGHRQTGFFATGESIAPTALGSTSSGLV
jgi:hypothetical protein